MRNILQVWGIVVGEMDSSGYRQWTAVPASDGEFGNLFDREQVAMLRLAAVLTGSVGDAEDVVQDAFAAVHQRWEDLDRPGAYLRTSVVNGCRMVVRHRGVESRHLNGRDAEVAVELPSHLVELREAVSKLDYRQRVVVVLRYFVDLPDKEIAEVLGCRPSTVRSLAHRGLALLRKELT